MFVDVSKWFIVIIVSWSLSRLLQLCRNILNNFFTFFCTCHFYLTLYKRKTKAGCNNNTSKKVVLIIWVGKRICVSVCNRGEQKCEMCDKFECGTLCGIFSLSPTCAAVHKRQLQSVERQVNHRNIKWLAISVVYEQKWLKYCFQAHLFKIFGHAKFQLPITCTFSVKEW